MGNHSFRVICFFAILLICSGSDLFASSGKTAGIPPANLYRVNIGNHDDAYRLTAAGVDVVLKVTDGYLVLLKPEDFERLNRSGLEVTLVASNIDRAHLAMDMRRDRENVDKYDLVFEDKGLRLFRVDFSRIDRKSGQAGIAPLRDWHPPVKYIPQKKEVSLKSLDIVDLDSLLSEVRQDSLESYSYHLEQYGGRPAGSAPIHACADWLVSKFQDFGYDSIEVDTFYDLVYGEWGQLRNVIAYKAGTVSPDYCVIFGAHYDAALESPGADDNGSGTAAVLDIARVMADLETGVSYGFALWDGEEVGLFGSFRYAVHAANRGERIVLYVNMDMIGHYENDIDADVTSSQDKYEQLITYLADSIDVVNISFHPCDCQGSDHTSFEQSGYDVISISEYILSTMYHTPFDSTSYLNFDYMTRMARSALLIGYVVGEDFVPDPELIISVDGEPPQVLFPQSQIPVTVTVAAYGGAEVVPGGVHLHYSIDGGEWIIDPMTETGNSVYTACLPSLPCESRVLYYVTAEEDTLGTYFYPGVDAPVHACVATRMETIIDDNFETDMGWEVTGDASQGDWVRIAISNLAYMGSPGVDYDGNKYCYLTGPDGFVDIDDGSTTLTSPTLDGSAGPVILHYARWYSNNSGQAPFSDVMHVQISNNDGLSWRSLETIGPEEQASGGWYSKTFWLNDLIPPTDQIRLRFIASDEGDDSQVKAGVDAFSMVRFTFTPLILTDGLPHWTVGVPYEQQLEAVGCSESLTWSDKYGHLEGSGLSVSPTGLVSGTPLEPGLVLFAAEAVDDIGQDDQRMYSFMINPALTIETENLPGAMIGQSYDFVLMAEGGTGSKFWTDRDNILEGSGLTVTPGGHLMGTPVDTGVINLVVRVEDQVGAGAEEEFVLTVSPDYDCGDANGDQTANIADAVYIINFVFKSGPPPEPIQAGDANCDGDTNVGDAVYMINYVFKGGPAPCCP